MYKHSARRLKISALAALAMSASSAPAQCDWHTLGAGFNQGERGVGVHAFTIHQSQLIAGGDFIHSGGVPVHVVARWDGSAWQQVGPTLPGTVNALTIYQGELIAAGYFDIAGDIHNVMRFNGTSWQPLSGGPNFSVYALTEYNGELIAGGLFYEDLGAPGNNVARWNGTRWASLGDGIEDVLYGASVSALTVYNGDLIAGGTFFEALGAAGNMVARWDGTAWHPLGIGMADSFNPGVFALQTYQGQLIAGGDFLMAGGQAMRNLARWNGSVWSNPGNPANDGRVCSLTVFNDELITGKNNTEGGTGNMIDRWNGSEWSALEPNINDTSTILALMNFDGGLIVGGGFFTLPSGATAYGVASWCAAPACAADIAPAPNGDGQVNVDDLLTIINAWGACANPNICPPDIIGNGVVNVDDLLAVINAWGACS